MIHLVDRDHVRNLHDSSFQRLHGVAGARHQDEQDRVGDPDHLDLALSGSDGLEEDELLAGRVEQERGLKRRLGEATEVTAGAHRADEDTRVEEVVGEPDPVAEERSVREGTRRIDGDHADRAVVRANVSDERADQRRLADSGRAGDADDEGPPRLGIQLAHELVGASRRRSRRGRSRGPARAGRRPGRPPPAARASSPRGPRSDSRGSMRAWDRRARPPRSDRPPGRAPWPRRPRPGRRRSRAPQSQRAPNSSTSGPATAIPSPKTA